MLTTWANKNLIPAIGSTKALVHVFIVILFFENYNILAQGKSLFNISITFDKIHLAPFISFFFFIVVTKVIWSLIWGIRNHIWYKPKEYKYCRKASFAAFLLALLLLFYLIINIINEFVYAPINLKQNFWGILLYVFMVFTMVISFLYFIAYPPESVNFYIVTKEAGDNN